MTAFPFGQRLRPGQQRAPEGMFRIVAYYGDHMYQVGQDQVDLKTAGEVAARQPLPVQVFDEFGRPRLGEGGRA